MTLVLLAAGITSAAAQGPLTNGWTYNGVISFAGQSNSWTFTASNGQSMVVAMGAINGNLYPYLRLYGPNGALLTSGFGANAAEVSARPYSVAEGNKPVSETIFAPRCLAIRSASSDCSTTSRSRLGLGRVKKGKRMPFSNRLYQGNSKTGDQASLRSRA